MSLDVLPDCRAKNLKGGKFFAGQMWYPFACANCKKDGGYCPENNMTFAFWLCEACYETHGAIAATMVTPDEVFWEKVNHDLIKGDK